MHFHSSLDDCEPFLEDIMVWFSRSDEKKKHDQDKYACKIILIFLDYFNKVYRILTLFTLTSGFMTGSLYYNIGKPLGSTSIICQKKMANLQTLKYLLRNLVL